MSVSNNALEQLVRGFKDFILTSISAFVLVLLHPAQMLRRSNRGDLDAISYPNAFLLACAITQGFLAQGLATWNSEGIVMRTVSRAMELSVTSFVLRTVVLFVIVIACGSIAGCMFRDRTKNEQRSGDHQPSEMTKTLLYYIIGSYSIVLTVFSALILWFISTGSDNFLKDLNRNVIFAAILISTYVVWLFSTTWYLIFRTVYETEKQSPIWMKIKLACLSAIVTVLCISNVIAVPYWEYEEESTLLRGQMVELDILDDETIRLTFLLENVGSSWAVVNFGDPYEITIEYGDGEGTTAEAEGGDRCGTGPAADRFLRLNAGEARVLAACVTDPEFHRLVTGPNFLTIDRGGGVVRLVGRHPGAVTFSVVLEVMNAGDGLHGLKVPL